MNRLARGLGIWLGVWLSRPAHVHGTSPATDQGSFRPK